MSTNKFSSCLGHSKILIWNGWHHSATQYNVFSVFCPCVEYVEFKNIASFIWLADKFGYICPATEIWFFLLYFWHFISPYSALGAPRVSLSVLGFSSCGLPLFSFVWSLVYPAAFGVQKNALKLMCLKVQKVFRFPRI